MKLKEKYTTKTKIAKDAAKEEGKACISDDAFAVAEVLENKLEHIRQTFLK